MSKKSFTDKTLVAIGGAALASTPMVANAAPVLVNDRPIVIPLFGTIGETINWDIDGNGSTEFQFFRNGSDSSYNFGTGVANYQYRSVFMASITSGSNPLNGRGLVAPPASLTTDTHPQGEDDAVPLFASFVVGEFLENNYKWGRTSERYRIMGEGTRTLVSYTTGYKFTTSGAYIGYDFVDYGFQPGPNFFGFRFEGDAGTQYGWGVLNYGGGPEGPTIYINYWEYGSEAGEDVHISEPATAVPALALLAMGAAGVRHWRRRSTADES